MVARTLYDKLFDSHVVRTEADGTSLLYIDRHLVHEVTSPQAFEGLRLAGRKPWRAGSIVATADHNTPTKDWHAGIADPISRTQVETLDANMKANGAKAYFPFRDRRQGIVHVIGPEQGATLPGMTVVCGDSHTSTHGAFAALAFGIGTSEVEHVLATQCLLTKKLKAMQIRADGRLPDGLTAKDLVLAVIGKIGIAGGTGYAIEFAGSAIRALSMEGRMTVCNMAIEAGARSGMVAADDVDDRIPARAHVRARPRALGPRGRALALARERRGREVRRRGHDRRGAAHAAGHLGHVAGDGRVDRRSRAGPRPRARPARREGMERALAYMGLKPGTPIAELAIDRVFIGSCTNSRIEDLRAAAAIARGRRVASTVKHAMVVPGSGLVKAQAEREGLDRVFRDAGFDWREPGCSMCLAMNDDRLEPGERCASTSNRNFEGRQGAGGRTHLVSPAMAAAAAIAGHFVDVRRLA